MTNNTGLARRPAAAPQQSTNGTALAARLAPPDWSRDYIQVLKDTYAKRTTDAEFALAVQVSKATGLRIDTHELWVYKRGDNEPVTITISVDGFRAIAHSSGVYAGEEGPFWCGKDGQWVDVWLDKEQPAAAKFIVWRRDFLKPFVAVILLNEFRNGSPFWKDKPVHQSGVRAATHAFRKAFRQEIGAVQNTALELGASLGEAADSAPPALATEYAPRLSDATTGEILDAEIVAPASPPATVWPKPGRPAPPPASADRELVIDDFHVPPEDEDADDIEYLQAASVQRPPVQAPPIEGAPEPARPAQTVQQARARQQPKTREEKLVVYRSWVSEAQHLGVEYIPEVQFADASDEEFRVAANDLVARVRAARAGADDAAEAGR